MLVQLDIQFSFLRRSSHTNDNGKNPIVLRICFRNTRQDVFTGLFCSKESWNSQDQKLHNIGKEAVAINKNLEQILRKANDVFDALRFSREDFTIDDLVNKLKAKEDEPELLIDYLEKGNQSMLKRVGVEIKKATYYKYRRSLQYMQEFCFLRYRLNT